MQVGGSAVGTSQLVVANVDWFAATIRFECKVDWRTCPTPRNMRYRIMGGTAVWNVRVLVCNEYADKVATILCEPKSERMFAPNVALIEVANEWLYHGIGWEKIIWEIQQAVPFEVVGLSRVDLCADFTPTKLQREIIIGLSKHDYYVAGKDNGAGFWSNNSYKKIKEQLAEWARGIPLTHQQSWGHKTSDIKWKLYYKSRELIEVEDKPYIRDQWKQEGLDCSDTWRLEVSVHYPHKLLLHGQSVSYDVFNAEWLSFLRSLYQTRFVVRKSEGHIDKTNDTEVDFLPALSFGGVDLKCRPQVEGKRRNGRISLLRKLCASLDDETVLLDDASREGVFALMETIILNDKLSDYFHAMVDSDFYEWIELKRVDAYSRTMA